jgi:pyridoxine 4-dehydrogenase
VVSTIQAAGIVERNTMPQSTPLATGGLTGEGSPLTQLAADHGVSSAQLALAWLLKRSPVMLPIPGTSSIAHLEDNIAAAAIELTDAEFDALSDAAK